MNGAEEALLVFWGEKWIKGSSFLCTSGGEAFLGGLLMLRIYSHA